ncbi:unnamed protein product [Cunninghamella blakesleeana]
MGNRSQRGRGRGNSSRGRGRGGGGGGGRGRNQSLQPTSFGFVYPLTDTGYNMDDDSKRKSKIKKQQLNRNQRNETDNVTTGISSLNIIDGKKSKQKTKTNNKNKSKKSQFTNISDTSKHFIRSENTLNDPTQNNNPSTSSPSSTTIEKSINANKATYRLTNEDIIDNHSENDNDNDDNDNDDNGDERDIDLNNLHQDIDNFDVDEEAINKLIQLTSSLTAETNTSITATTSTVNDKKTIIQKDIPLDVNNKNEDPHQKTSNEKENQHQPKISSSTSSATNTTDDPYEFEISEDDLECDTDAMEDFIENISLNEDEIELILNRNHNHFNLDDNEEDEEDEYEINEDEDDEDAMLSVALEEQYLRELELYGFDIEDDEDDEDEDLDDIDDLDDEILARSAPFMNGNDYNDDEISPEMFRFSLEEALAAVPPGLKPGVRNWLSHEKKEQKKQKRLEKKQKRKESKEKNKSKKNNDTGPAVQLRKIDSRLQDFIMDDQIQSLHFAPMPKNSRRQLHLLATAYNLKSHSTGSGTSRTPIVTKTDRTFLPPDRRYIERFIEEAQSTLNSQSNILSKHRMDNNNNNNNNHGRRRNNKSNNAFSSSSNKRDRKKDKGQKSFDKNKQNNNDNSFGKSTHGTVVASDAAPIDENNVGHRLLAAMGWRQGTGLGTTNDGITAPIEAVIRGNRRGLGT